MSLTSKDTLVLFFGLYWALSVGAFQQYRLFDTHRWSRKVPRALWGVLLVHVLPLVYLVAALNILPDQRGSAKLVGNWTVPGGVLSSAIAALGLLGLRRIAHALVASPKVRGWLYDSQDGEDQQALEFFNKRWPSSSFAGHAIGGVVWLASTTGFALLLSGAGY